MWRLRSVLMRIVLVLLTLSVGVLGIDPIPAVSISGAAGSAGRATGPQSLTAISCPSVTVCYAIGHQGTILATTNAGATWQRQTSGTKGDLFTIDCPSVSVCFVLVRAPCDASVHLPLLSTTDGGSTWTKTSLPPGCSGPGPACPSVTTCYVRVGLLPPSEFFRTTDSGRSWQGRGAMPRGIGMFGVPSLACPGTTVCYFGGEYAIARSTNGGRTWRISHFKVAVPSCSPAEAICLEFGVIACPSESTCYAGGCCPKSRGASAVVAMTSDGGRTWRRHQIPRLGQSTMHAGPDMSCPALSACFAMDSLGRIATTTDGGVTWQVGHVTTPYPFTALACPSATVCYAAGYLGRLTGSTDGSTTWRDLVPALFVSGTYGAKQPLHTYSRWFTASQPWQVTLGMYASNPPVCEGLTGITVYVQNLAKTRVAGPIHTPAWGNFQYTSTVRVTGRLRLDVVTPHCSSFSVRVDGVRQSQG